MVRTKYRKTWDEEEIEVKAEQRRRKGQDPDWDVILNRTSTAPLVIVDGYNIIHKWPRLQKHMRKNDPGRARQLLVDDLESMRSIKGWRIEVVFDGAGKDNRVGPLGDTGQRRMTNADKAENKEVSKYGVRVVFTGTGIEADSYIESKCAMAKNVTKGELTGSLIVATDDAMIRLAGQNAGAMCMSADRFVSELKAIKKTVAFRVEAAMAKVNGERIRPEKLWGSTVFASASNKQANPQQEIKNSPDKETSQNKPSKIPGIKGVRETEDGRTVYTGRFGRNTLIIEDKRKKKNRKGNNTS
jgi:predicted RNA-binding protein with PIN domain